MARAATRASEAGIPRQHNPLTFVFGAYKFQIAGTEQGSVYSVTDGTSTLAQPLDWAFGTGEVGQTYAFRRGGSFYESRVSYHPALQALDLTLGHDVPAPTAKGLPDVLGRAMETSFNLCLMQTCRLR
jgi:hypothetical protein